MEKQLLLRDLDNINHNLAAERVYVAALRLLATYTDDIEIIKTVEDIISYYSY